MAALDSLNILLVDDNANMRIIVATMLRSLGFERVIEAESAESAFRILAESPVDIAIVDFRMEGMDGVSFTHHVRHSENSPAPYLPVIMMTGHSERSRVTEARDSGVTEFLAKPVDVHSLIKRIEAVILRPRPFIRTKDFFGPDRRRQIMIDYVGPLRRSTDIMTAEI